MSKRLVLTVILIAVLIGMSSLSFKVQKVEASGTIYIRADGSIDPPTAPIFSIDNVTYTLIGNVTSDADGIAVERDNVVVDGAGYTVTGGGSGSGITLTGRSNVMVGNMTIENWANGIFLSNSDGHVLIDNEIRNNNRGIHIKWSANIIIERNNVTNNKEFGIVLWECEIGNIVLYNLVSNNACNIGLTETSGVVIYHNNFFKENAQVYGGLLNKWDNGYPSGGNFWSDYTGIDADGDGIGDTPYVIDTDNQDHYPLMHPWSSLPVHNINTGLGYVTIQEAIDAPETLDGHTIFVEAGTYYENVQVNKALLLFGESGEATIIDARQIGTVITITASGVLIGNFTIRNSGFDYVSPQSGIRVHSSNCNITDNKMANNMNGIQLDYYSSNNIVSGNNIDANNGNAIWLLRSSNNIISGNNITNNYGSINLNVFSSDNIIFGNNITNNGQGIHISESSNNTIFVNRATNNYGGIWLRYSSSNNTISGNNITNNNYCGIWVDGHSSNNTIYHNNFINNPDQVLTDESVNFWDDGHPSGGNYWSNYTGTDLYSGSYIQNETGSDGIGDTEYAIDGNSADHYPLMAPIDFFDAGTWKGITYYGDIVSNSTVSHFYFNPDEGAFASFWVKGETETEALGFCRVAIPKDLLWVEDGWTVLYGSYPLSYKTYSDENYTYLYFTYTNPSSNGFTSFTTVTINGTHVILEFPSSLILPLFMIVTLLAVIAYRKKYAKISGSP